ncbi:hypothetical protein [Catenulispora sp. MAP12-49]
MATEKRQVSIAAGGLDDAERAELAALREEEKETLGKAIQFSARESNC